MDYFLNNESSQEIDSHGEIDQVINCFDWRFFVLSYSLAANLKPLSFDTNVHLLSMYNPSPLQPLSPLWPMVDIANPWMEVPLNSEPELPLLDTTPLNPATAAATATASVAASLAGSGECHPPAADQKVVDWNVDIPDVLEEVVPSGRRESFVSNVPSDEDDEMPSDPPDCLPSLFHQRLAKAITINSISFFFYKIILSVAYKSLSFMAPAHHKKE